MPDAPDLRTVPERALLVRLLDEQSLRWRAGDRPPVEELLRAYPDLAGQADAVLDLIYNEVVQREKAGIPAGLDEYLARFPHLADELRAQFEVHAAVRSADLNPATTVPFESAPATDRPTVPGYEIQGVLGRGGMGVVYLARQVGLKRLVALKVLRGGGDPAGLARFRREAETVARLRHPNIVQIHEIGDYADPASGAVQPYFAMEHVAGGSLKDRLDGTPWPAPRAAELAETLARAMHAAHRAGVVHRDLKPGNVLLDGDDPARVVPKVADFGLAKRLDPPNGTDPDAAQTHTGAVLGTPAYMAPEQAGAARHVGPAADVYAVGVVLYELLTGRPPFRGATLLETLDQVRNQDPVGPRLLNPAVPRDVETVALKCLEKDPARRYASAEALAEDLGRFLAGRPILARPAGVVERAYRWVRRNPAVSALMAAVVLVLAAGGVVSGLYAWRAGSEWERANDRAIVAEDRLERVELALYAKRLGEAYGTFTGGDGPRAEEILGECPDRLRGLEHRLLETHFGPRQTFLGAADKVSGIAWSPDGRLLATVSGGIDLESKPLPGAVAVRDAATGKVLLTIPAAGEFTGDVAWSPDGKLLAAGGPGNTLRVWDAATGREVRVLRGAAQPVRAVAWSPDGQTLAGAGDDAMVLVWDAAGDQPRHRLGRRMANGPRLRFGPDGRLYAAGPDTVARVWDVGDGREVLALRGHRNEPTDVACHPDGKRLVTVSRDRSIRLWDARTGQEMRAFSVAQEQIPHCVAFAPDGKHFVTGGFDGVVRVWDVETGKEVLTLRGHAARVARVAYSPDGRRIASAGWDQSVKVWDAEFGHLPELAGHDGDVYHLAFHPDGRHLLSTSHDRTIRVWDAVAQVEVRRLVGHSAEVNAAAYDPPGRRIASVSHDKSVKVWDAATGAVIRSWPGHDGWARAVAFSPDGRLLATGGDDNAVAVWDAATGREVWRRATHGREVVAVAFQPRGTLLASASYDKTVKLWDPATGEEVRSLVGHRGLVNGVAFHPDGATLVTGGEDALVKVWDAATGECLRTLRGHTKSVRCVAFSPDGRRVLSGGEDDVLKIWEPGKEQELVTLRCPDGGFNGVAVSPDGRRVAGCTPFNVIYLWDASRAGAVRHLPLYYVSVKGLGFGDGRLCTWDNVDGLLAWRTADGQPADPADSPEPQRRPSLASPDGRWQARTFRSGTVTLTDLNRLADQNHWPLPTAADRLAYHDRQAAAAETAKAWFAAAFHRERVLAERPWDAGLHLRLADLHARSGRHDVAALHLVRGLLLDPKARTVPLPR